MERKMNAVLLSVMDFLPNLMTVSKIKTHTQIRMPAKAWITNGFAAKLERNMAIAVMISMEGVMTPKVAARPPENLFVYIHTKVATLTAIMPGVHWPMAK